MVAFFAKAGGVIQTRVCGTMETDVYSKLNEWAWDFKWNSQHIQRGHKIFFSKNIGVGVK